MVTTAIERRVEQFEGLTGAGTQVGRAIHDAILRGGEPAREVADILHGTWLGHPLHPVLTDVTIGAWVLGAAFDAVGELGDDDFAREVGDRLAAIGTASAIPTAVTGLVDYSAIPKDAAAMGTMHGLLNTINFGLYLLSLRERNRGRRRRGLLFSGVAVGLSTAAAWLGGHLVYRQNVGADHSEQFSEPEQWRAVVGEDEVAERQARCVEVEGKKVLLYRRDGQLHAIGAVCSHAGGPLHEGDFDGTRVQCPWHDSVFDLRDGSIVHGPATHPQPAFDARTRDGQVEIRLRAP